MLERGAKAGTFVEIKNAELGERAKVPHLSYIGDAEIGADTNMGAGGITANYDGESEAADGDRTRCPHELPHCLRRAGDDRRWSVDGGGLRDHDDVPPDALGVARARQTNIEGYGKRKRRQR